MSSLQLKCRVAYYDNKTSTGILTRCPSPTLIRLGLGPTNPGTITVAQETLLFRWAGFSPALKLLIPAFSLDSAPPGLAAKLQRPINAPLPYVGIAADLSSASVIHLSPVTFSAQNLLTSELLRTL